MEEEIRIGVYVCECGINIGGVVGVSSVVEYASTLRNVVIVRGNKYTCSDSGQQEIKKDIVEQKLNRVVVASCTPKTHEPIFREACKEAGLNPYLFEFANIREHASWIHMRAPDEATEKAKDLVRMAVARARLLEPQTEKEVPVDKHALVIGAGVAGIQASLDLADMGIPVYLVERYPSIGGRMAQLDKTFPTNDCSICILGPKMVEVARHQDIKLYSYSEVADVEGYIGNFTVTVEKKPRYIDITTCTGCAACCEKCPIEVPNEFNVGIGTRKAIYVPFPQAVPMRAVIDRENCIDCGACEKVCGRDAIKFDDRAEQEKLNVGCIVVATGFDNFDPEPKNLYGYGLYDNVITAMEFERLINASGPTMGKVVRPYDCEMPKKITFVQCAGSRDVNNNIYCSAYCCMYALKNSQLIKEKYPDTEVTILYMDIRAPYRGYEEFYLRARDLGIKFIRGKPAEVAEGKNGNIVVRLEDTLSGGKVINLETELLVLSIGAIPRDGTDKLQRILKIPRATDGFFAEVHPKLKPVDTNVDGVFIAGVAQGPKEIPYSIAQGSAAAARAARFLITGKAKTEGITAMVNKDLCIGCGMCIKICPYQALQLVDGKAQVTEALCKGCGTCPVTCHPGALEQRHFKARQAIAQIKNVSAW